MLNNFTVGCKYKLSKLAIDIAMENDSDYGWSKLVIKVQHPVMDERNFVCVVTSPGSPDHIQNLKFDPEMFELINDTIISKRLVVI